MNKFTLPILLSLALTGCFSVETYDDYYPDQSDPTVDGLDVTSEEGNAGGGVLVINGSGFGENERGVLVMLGSHNAEILSVTPPTQIEVRAPQGPITGGAVDLLVATRTGYTIAEDFYTYDMTVLSDGVDLYDTETQYLLVQNLWNSCYGGMMDNPIIGGCDTISYFGQTGIDGRGEFFTFEYPRVHTSYQGFVTGIETTPEEWQVYEAFETPYLEFQLEDLRYFVGDVALRNPAFQGQNYCVDLAEDPSVGQATNCQGRDVVDYDLGLMEFCPTEDDTADIIYKTYAADWPVKHNFFASGGSLNNPEHFDNTEIFVDIPERDINGMPLTLPGLISVRGEHGFGDPDANADVWTVADMSRCNDSNGDGEATLTEDGVILSWEPIADVEALGSTDPRVKAVDTYLHISVSYMNVGWFLGDGWGVRASTVVRDDNEYDSFSGRSQVGIPNSILYQFPTPNMAWSTEVQAAGIGSLGTIESDASFMLIEIFRITDYQIETEQGDLVFSYVTGDLTFPTWVNPLEAGSDCLDCLDGDGDGWTDGQDPDCAPDGGGFEVHRTSSYTCNDGLDNDMDLLFDSEDPDCASGLDGETNCGDGIDNDGDGWVDALDGECDPTDPSAQELGNDNPSWTCSDGLDSDGDGWVDGDDPACTSGLDLENDGFSGTACNDGIEDPADVDDLMDADDLYCQYRGADWDSEEPDAYNNQCADGLDNDGDGFFDAFDPDCEVGSSTRENDVQFPIAALECYDGIDNDMDGAIDAADSSCWHPGFGFYASGFMTDEGASHGTSCSDGTDDDNDGTIGPDGWIDGLDPDCKAKTSETALGNQTEDNSAYGNTECNDGLDNDSDTLFDADDDRCNNGSDNSEQW